MKCAYREFATMMLKILQFFVILWSMPYIDQFINITSEDIQFIPYMVTMMIVFVISGVTALVNVIKMVLFNK